MGIRQFKPVTSATRFRSVSDFAEVTKTEPERSLVEPLTKSGGRNNKGHITTRWRGGGQLCRAAGTSAQVVAKEGNFVTLRLRSTEMRMVRGECLATIGEVGNAEHELLSVGKAGKSRWLGRMPRVRGVAMNPVDHPLGGGEGKSSGGRPPTNPWGKVEGRKTRHKKKPSTKLIVRGRKRGKATQ